MTSISSHYTANSYISYDRTAAQAKTAQPSSTPTEKTTTSSAGSVAADPTTKPFSQVILDARAALDAGYQKLGHTANDETTGTEWRETVGFDSLDRRTLYAIGSNQGGLFSEDEVMWARFTMSQQEAEAMTAANPMTLNPAAGYKASIDFLDSVSPEEKSSLAWAQSRGTAQAGYLQRMTDEGRQPVNVDTGNLIVNLFARAYTELSAKNDVSQSVYDMPSWQKGLELWPELQKDAAPSMSLTV